MRRWIFRALAIAIGLSPIVLIELVLRLAGYAPAAGASKPLVEFAEERTLFVLNDEQDEYIIPPSRQPFFKPDHFAAQKSPNEFRIFCLGGSTVQGNPYSIATSFTTWLELSLQAADPSRHWQVVNCGGISYASYRLSPILQECLRYQPDLFILYVGDNEFLEDLSYQGTFELPQSLEWIAHLRLIHAAKHLHRQLTGREQASTSKKPIRLAAEVDALLDYQGGLAQYHRDDRWRNDVIDHFRWTLLDMVKKAKQAGVPVLLVDPVCNLKDCAPFKVETDHRLTAPKKSRFQDLYERAVQTNPSDEHTIEQLRSALAIDPRHAGAWFLLGQSYLAAGRDAESREALVRAKDEDVCPLRMIEPMRTAIYEIGQSTATTVVPVLRAFEQASPQGIPGDEFMLDHVHPSITGHQMIAALLLDVLVEQRIIERKADWKVRQQRLYRDHLATLDTPYYARGQEHLEGLRKWAQGRVSKLREEKP